MLLFLVAAGAACGQRPSGTVKDQTTSSTSGDTRFRVETVASGLEVPWAFAWLPNGDMLFTERRGRVRIIEGGKLRAEPVFVVPDVEPTGESGLMDITLHPNFSSNNFIYLSYAYNKDGKRDRVVRYTYAGGKFTDPKTIIEDIPAAQFHAGMRCRFGPDGKLYVSDGDSTKWDLAQQMDSLAGKILRLNDDGSVPQDNPFIGKQGARPEIWAYGVRNP
ncbi:MAG TPA: PQQ-dependent sugar dehydrogenase, partial [Pyrinomonadaceae bacterium]|nr:PQQ-dependent sugar dehydrogenase [Pyrinomonadaceae bacterium]